MFSLYKVGFVHDNNGIRDVHRCLFETVVKVNLDQPRFVKGLVVLYGILVGLASKARLSRPAHDNRPLNHARLYHQTNEGMIGPRLANLTQGLQDGVADVAHKGRKDAIRSLYLLRRGCHGGHDCSNGNNTGADGENGFCNRSHFKWIDLNRVRIQRVVCLGRPHWPV